MAKEPINRRRFLIQMAKTVCGVSLAGLLMGLHARKSAALPDKSLRPPGALSEDRFLTACTRCGMCVQDCPYDILKLATLGEATATGTPYFEARTGPCAMCEDVPCVKACPTGALDPALTDINKAHMGLAVVIDQENCIAFQGLRCEVCFNICPLRGKAITLEYRPNKRTGMHAIFPPVVHSDHCTGCGLCERACILEEAAVKVLPLKLAKGELGHHYRLGWDQKGEQGKRFPTADPMHQYNLPQGERYDYAGRGLMEETSKTESGKTPFGSNALHHLNQGFAGGLKGGGK